MCRLPMPIKVKSKEGYYDTAHGPTQHPYGEPLKIRRSGKVRQYLVIVRADGKCRCITSSPASIGTTLLLDAACRSSKQSDDRHLPNDIEDGLGEYIKHSISYSP